MELKALDAAWGGRPAHTMHARRVLRLLIVAPYTRTCTMDAMVHRLRTRPSSVIGWTVVVICKSDDTFSLVVEDWRNELGFVYILNKLKLFFCNVEFPFCMGEQV